MAISVHKAYLIRDGVLVEGFGLPKRCIFRVDDIAGFLTSVDDRGLDGPSWDLLVDINDGPTRRRVALPLVSLLSAAEYERSGVEPLSLTRNQPDREPGHDWIWLFKDTLYVTSRLPFESEMEEVVLRIKALHFQGEEKLRRLREQVANFEAVIQNVSTSARKPIPDDVKILVWSRDGGVCVRCGASSDLHFDHIIPLVKGGGNQAENIQLLCRTCNLSKGGRLA